MSQIYNPTPTEHGSYVLPSDGDPAVAESVNQSLRDLADSALRSNNVADAAAALAAQMVNGVTGGSYSPTADIRIRGTNGGGLTISDSGTLVLDDSTLTVRTNATLSVIGSSTFTGTETHSGTESHTGTATFSDLTASALAVLGDTTLGEDETDALRVLASATAEAPWVFEAAVTFEEAAEFETATTFRGDLTVSNAATASFRGPVQFSQPLTYTNKGRVPFRISSLNSSATVQPQDGNFWLISTNISSAIVVTLGTTGAVDGDFFIFMSGASDPIPFAVTLDSPTFGQSETWPAGRNSNWNLFVYWDGSWFKMNLGGGYP